METSTGALGRPLSSNPSTQRPFLPGQLLNNGSAGLRILEFCLAKGSLRNYLDFPDFSEKVQRKVAQEWGLDYPYVPDQVMEVVEHSREEWENNLVWDYLHVPKPNQNPKSEVWARFKDIQRKWKLGRAIYKDKVLVV